MYTAAVIGASGYTGGELLRILARHPEIRVVRAFSRSRAGQPIHYAHPHLRGFYNLRFEKTDLEKTLDVDIVFNALPHGEGVHFTARQAEVGSIIVDLSADYRLVDPEQYRKWYGFEHPYPDLLEKFVYGLPEVRREELRGARLIASPGCNSTVSILASAPLVKERVIDTGHIIIDVKVGSSEAGRKPYEGSHHPEREGTIRPYSPRGHRHVAEYVQEASRLTGESVRATMIPHAVPAIRGAFASVHGFLTRELGEKELWGMYARFYRGSFFARIVYSTPLRYPDVKNVVGSNFADISFAIDEDTGRVTGFAAIDNLVKGASGQAVQALNIALGLPEQAGMDYPPIKP